MTTFSVLEVIYVTVLLSWSVVVVVVFKEIYEVALYIIGWRVHFSVNQYR